MSALEAAVTIMVAALAGALSPMMVAFFQRKKTTVDVAQQYELMASKQAEQIDKLKARIEAMEAEMNAMQCDIEARDRVLYEYLAGINVLTYSLEAHQIQVPWTPKSQLPPKRQKAQ